MLKKVPYISQLQETECGLCCCAMILNYHGYGCTVKELRNEIEVGRDGLSFNDMREVFVSKNYRTQFYEASVSSLGKISDYPLIIFWEQNHYVILEKIKNNYYYIVDPAKGREKLTRERFEQSFSGIVLQIIPTEKTIKRRNKENVWFLYTNYFTDNRLQFFKIFLLSLLFYLMSLFVPLMLQSIIDLSVNKKSTNFIEYVFYVSLFIPFMTLLYYFRKNSILKISCNMDRTIYQKLVDKLFKIPYEFYLSRNSSDILYRIALVRSNREFLVEFVFQGVLDIGLVIIILIILFKMSVYIFGIVLTVSLISTGILLVIKDKTVKQNKIEILESTKLQGLEYESLSAMFTIKASLEDNYMKQIMMNQYDTTLSQYKKRIVLNNLYGTVVYVFTNFAPLSIFLFSVLLYGKGLMSLGSTVSVYTFGNMLFGSLSSIFNTVNVFGTMKNNLLRINEIIEYNDQKNLDGISITKINTIEFKNVTFRYPGQKKNILENLSFKLNSGEKIGIVGKTGSGKSTIIGLLLGLYEPVTGSILINDIDLRFINKISYKKLLGFVPQEPFVFNKSIKDNILMNRNYKIKDVESAADKAEILEEIQEFPMKFETIIAELGHNISGGQKQRIIIARALLSKPGVLVFDEATSSVDNETERKISENLSKEGSILINVAHRLSTIVDSDKIIVMKNGTCIGQGNHKMLLKSNDFYKQLYEEREELNKNEP